MRKKFGIVLLCLSLMGCDRYRASIFNSTESPAEIAISTQDHGTIHIANLPAKEVFLIRDAYPDFISVEISLSSGQHFRYSRTQLQELADKAKPNESTVQWRLGQNGLEPMPTK